MRRGYPRNANIDRFSFHMLAVQRNAIAMFAEIVIAPRGPIAADDVDLAVEMPQPRALRSNPATTAASIRPM